MTINYLQLLADKFVVIGLDILNKKPHFVLIFTYQTAGNISSKCDDFILQ